jgi:hypothetical protein
MSRGRPSGGGRLEGSITCCTPPTIRASDCTIAGSELFLPQRNKDVRPFLLAASLFASTPGARTFLEIDTTFRFDHFFEDGELIAESYEGLQWPF